MCLALYYRRYISAQLTASLIAAGWALMVYGKGDYYKRKCNTALLCTVHTHTWPSLCAGPHPASGSCSLAEHAHEHVLHVPRKRLNSGRAEYRLVSTSGKSKVSMKLCVCVCVCVCVCMCVQAALPPRPYVRRC